MIRALLLDLGETLIDSDRKVLPGVEQALTELAAFKTQDHAPLVICLVSDYPMPKPRTAETISAAFKEYLEVLDKTGLRRFFEPVDERVTLSVHAGVAKPAAAVFEMAFERAGIEGPISDALFITEFEDHITACRKLGMKALQFGADFTDWSAAPPLIAQQIGMPGGAKPAP